MLEQLKEDVLNANLALLKSGLVTLTWGNVSGISRNTGLVVIKPSGFPYEMLTAEDMVVVDLDGKRVEGRLYPSSDTPTHVRLYRAFPKAGGIAHTHSTYATMFAQACREIPCFGTTHADHFAGPVPVTRFLSKEEVQGDYEANTGAVIIERFDTLNPEAVPGVLVAGHAPFAWGDDPTGAVKNSIALEQIAQMAFGTLVLNPQQEGLPQYILDKHFHRKHGPNAYYGQHP